jgi:hypothetical protein
MRKLLQEIVTPELIERLRVSVDGIYQGFKSVFFDPDSGLFGLGRMFKDFGRKMNVYGQYVNEAGEIVEDAALAAKEDMSMFDIIRDIFSNLGLVLLPIAESLKDIFDPLRLISEKLLEIRHYAGQFNKTFNQYREGFKALAKIKGNEFLLDTLDLRASLLAITNLLKQFGAIGKEDFVSIRNLLTAKDFKFGEVLQFLVDKLLDSEVAEQIGRVIGEVVGTVLTQVAKVTGLVSGRIGKSSRLMQGLQKGFENSGGTAAVSAIFKDVFTSMFNVLKSVWNLIPWQAKMLAAAMLVLPAAIQGVGMALASGLTGALGTIKGILITRFLAVRASLAAAAATQTAAAVVTPSMYLAGAGGGAAAGTVPAGAAAAAGASAASGGGALATVLKMVSGAFIKMLPVLTKLSGILVAITIIGGGVEGTLRQLGAFLAEVGANLGSTFGGLFDTLGVLGSFVDDLFRRISGVFSGLLGVKEGFDALAVVLGIITLPLQLLSQTVSGLAVGLANLRVFLARWTGDPKYNEIVKERDELAAKGSADRGRMNAYNVKMQGPEAARKQLNDAIYEFQNNPKLQANRAAELREFIKGTRDYLKSISPDKLKTPSAPPGASRYQDVRPKPGFLTKNGVKGWQDQNGNWTPEVKKVDVKKPPSVTPKDVQKTFSDVAKLTAPKPKELSTFQGMLDKPKKAVTPAPSLSNLLATAPKPASAKAAVKPAAEIQQTAKNTFQLNQKAAQQVSAINATKNAANATKTATEATKNAVVAQKATLGTIQTTLSAMYGLLASGMLRVQTQMQLNGLLGTPGSPLPPLFPPAPPGKPDSFSAFRQPAFPSYSGNIGDAISSEMEHKPSGSDLVVANTSETIIPAAGGYGMKEFVKSIDNLSGAVAQVRYGGNKGKAPGGGSANWMQILEQDYLKNLNKPIPGGPVRGSGRGGLDTWEGPGQAYISPQSLQVASKQGMAASGPINITSPITINQQPGQDADALATIVAMKIGEAVADARAASLFV